MHKMPERPAKHNADLLFELAVIRIARVLFECTDSEHYPDKLRRLSEMWRAFENTVADYHNETGRLYADLAYNPGEWLALKIEALEAEAKGQLATAPVPLETYRANVQRMIAELEHGLKIAASLDTSS